MADDQAFVNELWQLWNQNFVVATLRARLEYHRIPSSVIGTATRMNASFRADQATDQFVSTMMGQMGFVGGTASAGLGSWHNPEEMMFYSTLGQIVGNRGDPTAAPGLVANASKILRGEINDPFRAFEFAAGQLVQLIGILRLVAGETLPILQRLGLWLAALAVPREEIYALLGIPAPIEVNPVQKAIEGLAEALKKGDAETAGKKMIAALDEAAKTPTPEDDIQIIAVIAAFSALRMAPPNATRAAVERLRAIDYRAQCNKTRSVLALLIQAIVNQGLVDDLGPDTVPLARALLKVPGDDGRVSLALATSNLLGFLGAAAEARRVLAEIQPKLQTADERVSFAIAQARLLQANDQRVEATTTLRRALESNPEADQARRREALIYLLDTRPDAPSNSSDSWVEEFRSSAAKADDPVRTKVEVAAYFSGKGKSETARSIIRDVDLGKIDTKASPWLAAPVAQLQQLRT